MSLRDLFPEEQNKIKGFGLDERIQIIGLSQKRVEELEKILVKEIPYNSNIDYEKKLNIIDTDKIVGLARPFWDQTWLDVLSDKYCHKNRDFELFNAENFDDILLCEQVDGYPTVVEFENEYYISGNGLHRLTIAKCIGNKKAKVIVEKVK